MDTKTADRQGGYLEGSLTDAEHGRGDNPAIIRQLITLVYIV